MVDASYRWQNAIDTAYSDDLESTGGQRMQMPSKTAEGWLDRSNLNANVTGRPPEKNMLGQLSGIADVPRISPRLQGSQGYSVGHNPGPFVPLGSSRMDPAHMQGKHLGGRSGIRTPERRDMNLVGILTGNIAYRQNVRLGSDGMPFRIGGATTAIKYRSAQKAGRYGFNSMYTGRFRLSMKTGSYLTPLLLTKSTGPNKSPHGIAQSSLDTTKERYITDETQFEKTGTYNRAEQWNQGTQRFERQWSGWKDLKINKTWKHYKLNLAPMFKEQRVQGIDTGAARRVERRVR